MSHSIINPAGLHDSTRFGYSHVAQSGELVVIAGQYASGLDGNVTSTDFAAQVKQSMTNLGAALHAVDLDFQHVIRIGTYVVDHDASKLAVILEEIAGIWGTRPPTQTLIGVAALSLPDMLFEIDALAVRRVADGA